MINAFVDVFWNLRPVPVASREDSVVEGLVLCLVVDRLVFVGERINPADVSEGLDKIDLRARVDHLMLVQKLRREFCSFLGRL